MNRRALLLSTSASLAALSGCSALQSLAGGCGEMEARTLRLDDASLDDERRSKIAPIVFSDLPESERAILETARDEGEYRVCPPSPDALQSLTDRVQDHRNQQYENAQPTTTVPRYLEPAYLTWETDLFAIRLVLGDEQVS
ncbi:hypothetical protein [Haloarchaeobius sp. DFWS5]|uniref:hypothetical protein n=1 Tax=Haloarchaeobius sp. DFWS5 TaxID=3446114 RepID=UPI003EB98DF7